MWECMAPRLILPLNFKFIYPKTGNGLCHEINYDPERSPNND